MVHESKREEGGTTFLGPAAPLSTTCTIRMKSEAVNWASHGEDTAFSRTLNSRAVVARGVDLHHERLPDAPLLNF